VVEEEVHNIYELSLLVPTDFKAPQTRQNLTRVPWLRLTRWAEYNKNNSILAGMAPQKKLKKEDDFEDSRDPVSSLPLRDGDEKYGSNNLLRDGDEKYGSNNLWGSVFTQWQERSKLKEEQEQRRIQEEKEKQEAEAKMAQIQNAVAKLKQTTPGQTPQGTPKHTSQNSIDGGEPGFFHSSSIRNLVTPPKEGELPPSRSDVHKITKQTSNSSMPTDQIISPVDLKSTLKKKKKT